MQWYASGTGNHQGLVVEEGTGRNVAVTYESADAALIAAAPELMAALEGSLVYLEGSVQHAKALAAIAKATEAI